MHLRAEIKNALVGILKDKTIAGDRVYPAMYLPVRDTDLPAICIFIPEEDIEEDSNLTDVRTAHVAIECLMEDSSPEKEMDEFSKAVETLVAVDRTLGGIVKSCRLKKVKIGEDESANRDLLAAAMIYDAVYTAPAYAVESDLADFTSAHVSGGISDVITLEAKEQE